MEVVDLTDRHMRFVATCTHMEGNDEAISVREQFIRKTIAKGHKVKVAIRDDKPVGFAHCVPIEECMCGMIGKDLMTLPCLTIHYELVYETKSGGGVGRALVKAVEQEAVVQGKKGVAVLAFDHEFWFMPAPFFRKMGYWDVEATDKEDEILYEGTELLTPAVLLMKAWDEVDPPTMFHSGFIPELVEGKVVVTVFWNEMCPTSIQEALNVKDVCEEFGDKCLLREFNCSDSESLEKHQTSRAVYIEDESVGWGYAAPVAELRKKIQEAIDRVTK